MGIGLWHDTGMTSTRNAGIGDTVTIGNAEGTVIGVQRISNLLIVTAVTQSGGYDGEGSTLVEAWEV